MVPTSSARTGTTRYDGGRSVALTLSTMSGELANILSNSALAAVWLT
jgi:hypothetical protein